MSLAAVQRAAEARLLLRGCFQNEVDDGDDAVQLAAQYAEQARGYRFKAVKARDAPEGVQTNCLALREGLYVPHHLKVIRVSSAAICGLDRCRNAAMRAQRPAYLAAVASAKHPLTGLLRHLGNSVGL